MKTILIIEDEPQMRANLATILKMENYRVVAVTNGRDGIDAAKRESPDLILCDIMMPGADGHQVLKELRESPETASIPLIFLTAKTDRADLRAGMNRGADDYLTKPITVPELRAAIEARLKRHGEQQTKGEFKAEFKSAAPLQKLGLTPREADVLFWVAQGKTNAEIGLILDMSIGTVKKHMEHILPKVGVENRSAAVLRAVETLSGSS
ncbi:MAG: response regulator transcription factor [Verrucomicrobiae bacterium]|nr:response regulator transcription factor [Verrucomicrobiae bacterium]